MEREVWILNNEELMREGRSYMTNGIVSYACAFGIMQEEDIDQDTLSTIDGMLESLEAVMPVFVSMWEMTNKLSGANMSFFEWLEEIAKKSGGSSFM